MSNTPHIAAPGGSGQHDPMQVDGATVMAIVSLVASIGMGLLMAFRKEAASSKDEREKEAKAEVERRLRVVEEENRVLKNMVHEDALATEKLRGQVGVIDAKHNGFDRDISEIKEQMVRRTEFEQLAKQLEGRFDDVMNFLRQGGSRSPFPGRYPSGSTPSVPDPRGRDPR